MREIENAAAELVAHPVRPATPVAVLARTVRARRRRHGAVLSAVVLAVGGIAAGLAVSASSGGSTERVSTGPVPAGAPASGAGVTPPGFVRVDYGRASIAVPAGWKVITPGETVCPAFDDVVLLDDVQAGSGCPGMTGGPGLHSSYAGLVGLSGPPAAGARVEVNGHPGVRLPAVAEPGSERFAYPDLGVVLTVAGPQAAAIAGSVGWSAQHLAVHPAGPAGVPAGWKTVSYAGLDLRVPPSWPVSRVAVHQADPGVCGPPEFDGPQVYEGSGQISPSCPPIIPSVTAGVDGVWIRHYRGSTAQLRPTGSQPLGISGLQVVELPQPSGYAQPVLRLVVLPSTSRSPGVSSTGPPVAVSIDIGLGPDPSTASRILASLSTLPRLLPTETTNPMTVMPQAAQAARAAAQAAQAAQAAAQAAVRAIQTAQAALPGFVNGEAAAYAADARRAGQTWNGSLHSPAVLDDGAMVAVAAFSYAPAGHQVQVLGYSNGRWAPTASLAAPQGPVANSYWLGTGRGLSITAADPTGDGRPDFLIPEQAADNVPGAVLSQDGPTGQWRYIPFTGPFPTSDTIGRDPRFSGNTLVSTYDNCNPDCAQGANYTVTWTYQPGPGVFWAPDPPGWTAPTGATNHS